MAALNQARDGLKRHMASKHPDPFEHPIVVAKFDRQEPVVLMPLPVFEELVQKAYKKKK